MIQRGGAKGNNNYRSPQDIPSSVVCKIGNTVRSVFMTMGLSDDDVAPGLIINHDEEV